MEQDFYRLWKIAINIYPHLKLTIEYSKVCDWGICIFLDNKPLFAQDNCNRKSLFAKAYVWLDDYLLSTNGGY
jgi:hypothetical protein